MLVARVCMGRGLELQIKKELQHHLNQRMKT